MQYITTKKLTVALLVALCCVMGMIPVIAFSHSAVAEELPQLIVEEEINQDGDTVYHIQGIEEYMSAPQTRSSNSESRLNTLLHTLQYTDEQIATMSEEQKTTYAQAKEVYMSSAPYAYEEISSGTKYSYKLTMSMRVVRTGEEVNDFIHGYSYAYVMYGDAVYDKTQGIQWTPQTRGIDAMAFGWSSNARFTSSRRQLELQMECESASIWTGATKSVHYDSLKNNPQFITEYQFSQGWGGHIDLPNNTLANAYKNFEFYEACEVYAEGDFTIDFVYAHRTLNGTATLSTDPSIGMIYATSVHTDVAHAPRIFIQIPRE